MNKKAALGSQTMVYIYFLILIMILGGIVWGMSMFFGEGYDFREIDASLLNYRIKECLTEKDINLDINVKTEREKFEQEFYQKCRINQNVTDYSFFIFIDFGGEKNYTSGPGDRTQCALADKNKNYPRCVNSTLELGEKTIFIETGSNQKSVRKRT
ncbi:MAG: hypothetical protein ABIH92_03855 [Nanoarchaeota archaeon]